MRELIRLQLGRPLDLALTLVPLQRAGGADPSMRIGAREAWRATRTPLGPATLHIQGGDRITVEAWGPGSEWALERAPALLGDRDDDSGFTPRHPLIGQLRRSLPGLRLTRTEAVFESVLPTILEQKVPGVEARSAYRRILQRFGELAPGPGPGQLRVPPPPATLAALPYWTYHRFGVERRRAETVRRAALHAARLEEIVGMDPAAARARLMAIPGLGPWSAAEVTHLVLGDPDAVSIGDYHHPHMVCWALAGEPRGDDARMLELLEPYRGHRARVVRLLLAAGISAPRFGPRLRLHRFDR